MKYLLDTNVCIRFLNGRSPAIKEQLAAVAADDISLCAVVKAELIYGALKSGRPDEKAGQPIGPNDMLIATIALANSLTLVTHNNREFSHIPDLVIADWEISDST